MFFFIFCYDLAHLSKKIWNGVLSYGRYLGPFENPLEIPLEKLVDPVIFKLKVSRFQLLKFISEVFKFYQIIYHPITRIFLSVQKEVEVTGCRFGCR